MTLGRKAAAAVAAIPGVMLHPGLSDAEFMVIEARYGFAFADDHRAFLAAALPVGDGWVDWRNGDEETIRDRLAWPVEGILFHIPGALGFWYPTWGERPQREADALAIAREHLAGVPGMVPVYSHRFLPAGPGGGGHPVLSMHAGDIIVYGDDLVDYIGREFGVPIDHRAEGTPTVEFWRDLVS
ncbi:hypothetical protein HNR73_001630 [Phytomonospora endophytica]|uniref:SMI1/KNR4 family protein n=1 Tax=Phytomonospora endophytica TaxID=714109 RepID=A0A841FPA0_9ACTN|nr:hypothetical protein [Phytomonospora endophytica]MBB6033780.1 hypothetical protein [Phytomonospora endophytica]